MSLLTKSLVEMEKLEETLLPLLEYLSDDLAKESLSSKAEKKRLEYILFIDQAIQDSAANQIAAKYEPTKLNDSRPRQTSVLQGNIVPTPFSRSSVEIKDKETFNGKHAESVKDMMTTYETIPCGLTMYETYEPNETYDKAHLHGTSDDRHQPNSLSSTSVPASASATGTDTESDSGTDYEEYDDGMGSKNHETKETTKTKRTSSKLSHLRSGNEDTMANLPVMHYSGDLYQKGTFQFQFQKRFCAISNGWFLCCKSERSLKAILRLSMTEYEVALLEKRDSKASYPYELRFACPGKETYLFYTDNRQKAGEWVKELQTAAGVKQDSMESNAIDGVSLLSDDFDKQSVTSETSLGTSETMKMHSNQPFQVDDVRKKSKLQTFLGTVGKKLGNKSKALLQMTESVNTPMKEGFDEPVSEPGSGYIRIRSEEFTGDRWFRRFCRIHDGQLICYSDHHSETRPDFTLRLRGAQLKPIEEKDELKIKLVKDNKEHCLQMSNFMEHGRWLVTLIHETGFADQLLQLSKQNSADSQKMQSDSTNVYEELRQFYGLEGVIEDDSCPDEEPPPLPNFSPPCSPVPCIDLCDGKLNEKNKKKSNTAPEGIYLEPTGLLHDLADLKSKGNKKKEKVPMSIGPVEESSYINRDFFRKSKEKSKDNRSEISPSITISSSFPNLTNVGKGNEICEDDDGSRQREGALKAGGKRSARFRPSSALLELGDNFTGQKNSEREISKRNTENDRGLIHCPSGLENKTKRDNSFSVATVISCQAKSGDNPRRARTTGDSRDPYKEEKLKVHQTCGNGNSSSEDLIFRREADLKKKMVLDLVKMFEGNA